MNHFRLDIHSPEHMSETGRAIGAHAFPGCVILLNGEPGAGKTALAQGIALGLGVTESVTSPTYVIFQQYEGRLPFYHFDMYRLADEQDAAALGFEEYICGTGVSVIEWPKLTPRKYLRINISYAGETRREMELRACGLEYLEMMKGLGDF